MMRLSTLQRDHKKIRTFERVGKEESKSYEHDHPYGFSSVTLSRRKFMLCLLVSCVIIILFQEMFALVSLGNWVPLEKVEFDDHHQYPNVDDLHIAQPLSENEYPQLTSRCRHTDQGSRLACDSNGAVCSLKYLNQITSCCDKFPDSLDFDGSGSRHFERYTCAGCDHSSNCCSNYEICVSCCLHPHNLQRSRDMHLRESRSALRGADDFTWCSFTCRTSSLSLMQSENSFRSDQKHCFLGTPPAVQTRHSVNSDRKGLTTLKNSNVSPPV
jgi:hypothetical protein